MFQRAVVGVTARVRGVDEVESEDPTVGVQLGAGGALVEVRVGASVGTGVAVAGAEVAVAVSGGTVVGDGASGVDVREGGTVEVAAGRAEVGSDTSRTAPVGLAGGTVPDRLTGVSELARRREDIDGLGITMVTNPRTTASMVRLGVGCGMRVGTVWARAWLSHPASSPASAMSISEVETRCFTTAAVECGDSSPPAGRLDL